MIHERVSDRGAGFVRAWVFGLWAIYLVSSDASGFARVPDLEFDPPGILKVLPSQFYDALLTATGMSLLKWVLLAGVVACAFGVRPWRAIAIPTVLLLTVQQGISRGLFGYINHKELGALYAAYILAAFPATGFSPFAPKNVISTAASDPERDIANRRMMMLLLTSALLIPYTLVGLYRLAHNDFSIWSPETFAHHIVRTSYGTNWFDNAAISEAVMTRPVLLQFLAISFPIGTVVEVLAPLCIVHKRFRRVWAGSMVGLHLLTWLALDILFWENLALYPILLVDGDFLLKKWDSWRGVARERSQPELTDPPAARELASRSV